MKTPGKRRKSGFTLVELLVVIAIIVALSAFAYSAAMGAIKRAKKTTALNTCSSIETGINRFYDDYSQLPSVGATSNTTAVTTTSTNGIQLITILLGQEATATTVQNTKGVVYINLKQTTTKKGGIVYNGTTPGALYDPWGFAYNVMLDVGYTMQIPDPTSQTTPAPNVYGRHCLCYTLGASQSKTVQSDIVKTW